MTTETVRPIFGAHALQPDGLRAVYGGRWIVQQDGYTDMVPGRHGVEAESGTSKGAEALIEWLNSGALGDARSTASDFLKRGVLDTRRASPVILYQDDKGAIVANTNASAGYLYVTGWLFDDLPAESETKGLEKVLAAAEAAR